MHKIIFGLLAVFFLSCNDKSKDKNLVDLTDTKTEKNISLKLVDSIEKSSIDYEFYANITMYSFTSPFFFGDSVYILNNYPDVKRAKFKPQGTGNDICYGYKNGKCEKFIITHDNSKIYGYNQSTDGALQFTINNPFGAIDGYSKILYADTSLIFLLDNDIYRHGNNPSLTSDIIYRYDIAKKEKSEFYRTAPIRPDGLIISSSPFYINKVSEDRFLLAASEPTVDQDGARTLYSRIILFNAESENLYNCFRQCVYIESKDHTDLFQYSNAYTSFLFQIASKSKILANSTKVEYPSNPQVEYLSIGAKDIDIHLHENPYFFSIGVDVNVNIIGGLYFVKRDDAVYFVTKDFTNFYLIPYKKNKTIFSHIIYIPTKNKYYYIEIDNNHKDKIYIYEILNLENIY